MGKWSKKISARDEEAIKKAMKEQEANKGNRKEVPAGEYRVTVERLEIGETKDGRPMLKVMCRILEGEFKKHCIFMNRVLYGTKNDAYMIKTAIDFLESLEPSDEIGEITYRNMDDFDTLVSDIAEDIDSLEYDVEYDPDEFESLVMTLVED